MNAKTACDTTSLAVGADIRKEVFHLVGMGADGKIAFRRKIRRLALKDAFEQLPPCIAITRRSINAAIAETIAVPFWLARPGRGGAQSLSLSTSLTEFLEETTDELYDFRNRITYRDFVPRDNMHSIYLYFTAILPLLGYLLSTFSREHLRQDYPFSDHLRIAKQVCELAPLSVDLTYCIGSFAHLVRRFFQPTSTSRWEWQLITDDDEAAWAM